MSNNLIQEIEDQPLDNSILKIENRDNEEMNQLLSKPSNWFMRFGVVSITAVVSLLLAIGFFVKYPETLEGDILITSDPLPNIISMPTNNVMKSVFVTDGQNVQKGDPLFELKNDIEVGTISDLKNRLDAIESNYIFNISEAKSIVNTELGYLGAGQEMYNILLHNINAAYLVSNSGIHGQRINDLKKQMALNESYALKSEKIYSINKQESINSKIIFEKYNALYKEKVISEKEYLEEMSKLNQKKMSLEEQKKAIIQHQINIENYRKEIHDLTYDKSDQELQLKSNIEDNIRSLRNFINTWEHSFLFRSDTNGVIRFMGNIRPNTTYKAGDPLLAVLPLTYSILAEVKLSGSGIGKVEKGQKVQIMLDKFPFQEFGYLEGVVNYVSDIPNTEQSQGKTITSYRILVDLNKEFKTTYNKKINPMPESRGTARVITKDMSFLERIINQARVKT